MNSLDTFIRYPQMSPVFAGKLVEGHTCARANSSRSSHVLLTFSSEMVAFCTIATPPSPQTPSGGLSHPRGYAACCTFPHLLPIPPPDAGLPVELGAPNTVGITIDILARSYLINV